MPSESAIRGETQAAIGLHSNKVQIGLALLCKNPPGCDPGAQVAQGCLGGSGNHTAKVGEPPT